MAGGAEKGSMGSASGPPSLPFCTIFGCNFDIILLIKSKLIVEIYHPPTSGHSAPHPPRLHRYSVPESTAQLEKRAFKKVEGAERHKIEKKQAKESGPVP